MCQKKIMAKEIVLIKKMGVKKILVKKIWVIFWVKEMVKVKKFQLKFCEKENLGFKLLLGYNNFWLNLNMEF